MKAASLKQVIAGNLDLGGILLPLAIMGAFLVWSPGSPLLLPLSLIGVFFAPGYTLLAALYPAKAVLNPVQRISGSFGLSTVSIGLLILLVSKTIGMHVPAVFLSLAIFTCLLACIALYRRLLLSPELRFEIPACSRLPGMLPGFRLQDKFVWVIGLCLLFAGLAAVRLFWVTSQLPPQYTEFYLLGKDALAAGYPEIAHPRSSLTVTVGVDNHSDRSMDYHLTYQVNGGAETQLRDLTIDPGELWLLNPSVSLLDSPGLQQIKFILRAGQDNLRVQTLYLWVVVEPAP